LLLPLKWNLRWCVLIKTFITYVLRFFILRLRLRPMAVGRSLSGLNIRLQPKVKIAPTVQHWTIYNFSMYFFSNHSIGNKSTLPLLNNCLIKWNQIFLSCEFCLLLYAFVKRYFGQVISAWATSGQPLGQKDINLFLFNLPYARH
jgi:hypothetical protein